MKKALLIILIFLSAKFSYSQVGINANGALPDPSAMLDVSSTTKGMLVPRMTSGQRTGIASPAKGLLVFDNETSSFWYYNGSTWSNLTSSEGFTLPYSQTIMNGSNAFDISNFGTGTAIKGFASNVNSNGVYGETTNGSGVKGYSNNVGSVAVFGSSLQGTGVKAYSVSGTALDVIGNVKISGGNTNPSSGAVLTSDANGNAVWKNRKVGFTAKQELGQSVAYNSFAKLTFDDVSYDAGDDYHTSSEAPDNNSFVAPVSGFYHFSAAANLRITSATTNIISGNLILSRNNTGFAAGVANKSIDTPSYSETYVQVVGDVRLFAGDRVTVQGWAINNGDLPTSASSKRFSGHLVFAD
ncbi:MAG: hypothetical protein V4683_17045 [Bacteroidota bacterium]